MAEPPNSQRSATRAPVNKPIRLQFDDSLDVDEGHCINISIGGVYVHTPDPRPAGTLVRFELMMEPEQTIRGLGEVVWQQVGREVKGVGIKFRFLEQRDRQQIFKLVSQHIKARLERDAEGSLDVAESEPSAPEAAAFTSARAAATDDDADSPIVGSDDPPPLGPDETIPLGATVSDAGPLDVAPPAPMTEASPASAEVGREATVTDAAAAEQPSLFDRWDEPAATPSPATGSPPSVLEPLSQAAPDEPPEEPLAPDHGVATHASVATTSKLDDPGVSTDAGSGPAEALLGPRGASRRRRRDFSGWVGLALALAVAAGAAYFFRDRLFSGLLDAEASAGEAPVTVSEAEKGDEIALPVSQEPMAVATDPAGAPRPADRREEAAVAHQATPRPATEAVATPPVRSSPAEPLLATGGALRRLIDIRWRATDRGLVVTLTGDGVIAPSRIKHFRLGGASAREVVVLKGIIEPFARQQMVVGENGVATLRTGFHRKSHGNEIHVVIDLADADLELVDIRHLGERLELVVGPGEG